MTTSDPPPEPEQTTPGLVVPDGRTDYEKLLELLGLPEETHLDLKAELDLDSTEARTKFVKDVVAMSNRPPGGYILIEILTLANMASTIPAA